MLFLASLQPNLLPLPHRSGSAPLRHVNRQKVGTLSTSAATDGLQILLVIPHRAKATWTSPANRPTFEGRGRVRAPWGDQRQSQCPFRPSCSRQGAQPSLLVGPGLEQTQRILTEGEEHPDSRNRMPQQPLSKPYSSASVSCTLHRQFMLSEPMATFPPGHSARIEDQVHAHYSKDAMSTPSARCLGGECALRRSVVIVLVIRP